MDRPSTRLESRAEGCITNCVQRFIDSTNFVANRLQKPPQKLCGGGTVGPAAHYAEERLECTTSRPAVEASATALRHSDAMTCEPVGSMKEVLGRELDAESLLQAVKEQPQHKRNIWEQLKVVGFSRAVSTVYVGSLVAAAIRMQLMLLGGYTFGDLVHTGHAGLPISQTLQQKYLTAVHFLVEEGIPKLVQHVTQVVTQLVTGIPLNRPLTLAQLEAIFQEVRLVVAGESSLHCGGSGRRHKVEPWSKYVLQLPVPPDGESEEEKVLYNMLIETSDILDSEDFNTVMDTLIQQGFNLVLDRMADFYPVSKGQQEVDESTEKWVDSISRDLDPGTSPDSGDTLSTALAGPPQCSGFISNSAVPVAKLVPVLSGIVHAALSPTPGQLLQKVLTNDRLDALGANVYEAFALPIAQ
ncbi:Peroxisomal biogenesis factor 3 [Chionoecetes opilio]|uniref:Peroxisomal biogenesis factor 3 n=1 Tax=Chionoecetes opilio TaxID=41210 RepID=A0A8J4YJ27_CHIOP|nr:Peroxisomal biogenesis factor 3 [Chionoecetes opilio]